MTSKKYEIKYLETFILQFSGILYYIVHNLENKIAADNFDLRGFHNLYSTSSVISSSP